MMNRYYATKTAPITCQEDDPLTDAEHIRWMEINDVLSYRAGLSLPYRRGRQTPRMKALGRHEFTKFLLECLAAHK